MIRKRVPRSWVEGVIEVDDRDPAILDLDPNKSFASQIGEEDENDTIDSTYTGNISKSTVGFSKQSTDRKSQAPLVVDDNIVEESEQQSEERTDEDAVEREEHSISQICDDETNAEQSGASRALVLDGKELAELQQSEEAAKPDKNLALKSLFAKRAASMKEKDETVSTNNDKKDPGPPLKDDPEFAKFFKVGL